MEVYYLVSMFSAILAFLLYLNEPTSEGYKLGHETSLSFFLIAHITNSFFFSLFMTSIGFVEACFHDNYILIKSFCYPLLCVVITRGCLSMIKNEPIPPMTMNF